MRKLKAYLVELGSQKVFVCNILKQTGTAVLLTVVVYRSAFTWLAFMSSFQLRQLPLHNFYNSGLTGKKAVYAPDVFVNSENH